MSELSSGKGHRDENFPVASFLIAARHRGPVLAFYDFVRAADDVADHPTASLEKKLALLDDFRRTLNGDCDIVPQGVRLRNVIAERGLSAQHGLDLLEAFRRDVTKLRYSDWADLLDYCRYSAMPVGRFVLDVHGEDRSIWPLSDSLCAALQVINHLQDCGKDYMALNRVYIPEDAMNSAGMNLDDLGAGRATPALQRTIAALADKTGDLLTQSRPFAQSIRDFRLGLEVSVIQRLAEDLQKLLLHRDPLSQRVHHGKPVMAVLGLSASIAFAAGRLWRQPMRAKAVP